jgi:hypothetical protein
MTATTTARTLHFAQGLQRGVDLPLAAGDACVIGSSPEHCSVVLLDDGVAARHCALTLDMHGRVSCTAFDAAVRIGERELAPRASMPLPDFAPLRCGEATLQVGPTGSDWSQSAAAAAHEPGLWQRAGASLRRARASHPIALVAVLLGSTGLLAGSVWGTVSYLGAPPRLSVDNMARAQQWLKSVAPAGSELQLIADENRQRLIVSGYVPSNYQRELVVAAIAEQPDAPRNEVYSVEQMMASVVRLAQLEGVACVVAYRGAGRVNCTNEIADVAAADRLRGASAQIAGLRELALQVAPAAIADAGQAAAPPLPSAKGCGRKGVAVGRKFSILMSKKGNVLIGPANEPYKVGDVFEGMVIREIMLDKVIFGCDDSEYVFYVAQMK